MWENICKWSSRQGINLQNIQTIYAAQKNLKNTIKKWAEDLTTHFSTWVKSLSHVWLFATPWNYSLPGSSLHGILQARIWEWVAISFSKGSSGLRDRTWVSCMQADALTSEAPGKTISPEKTYRWLSHLRRCSISLIIIVQSLSHVWLCNPVDCSILTTFLFFTISQSLLKLHWVGDAIQPSHPLSPLLPLPSIFPSIKVFSNDSILHNQVAKVLELQLQHQSFQWILRVDFL